jgi:hypothetical protein
MGVRLASKVVSSVRRGAEETTIGGRDEPGRAWQAGIPGKNPAGPPMGENSGRERTVVSDERKAT